MVISGERDHPVPRSISDAAIHRPSTTVGLEVAQSSLAFVGRYAER
jgi:hypothetical protein